MKLTLKDEYRDQPINISLSGKRGAWHYNLQKLKESQYQVLYDNGYSYMFHVEQEDMPLYEEDEPRGLIDNTSYKKKAVTAKTKTNKND